jgi:hypothetical protein
VIEKMVDVTGIEPVTPRLQTREPALILPLPKLGKMDLRSRSASYVCRQTAASRVSAWYGNAVHSLLNRTCQLGRTMAFEQAAQQPVSQ